MRTMLWRCGGALMCAGLLMVAAGCGGSPSASSAVLPPLVPDPVAAGAALTSPAPILLGGEGHWDLLCIDPYARRLYLARSSRVMVVDLKTGKLAGELQGVDGAHGVALDLERDEGFASAGNLNQLLVFDLKTLTITHRIAVGDKPDAVLYDPFTRKVFCMNHAGGTVSIVDPAQPDAPPQTVEVGGTLELAASDGRGRVYVNVEDKSEVAVIDAAAGKVVARWPLTPGEEPTGLAIDPVHGRLFAGCHNQKMIVLDTTKGTVVGETPVGNGVDGIAWDAALAEVVVPNGKDGTVTVIRADPDGSYRVVQTLATAAGARTIGLNPVSHRFYLPCDVPAGEGGTATFGLIVVGPGKH
ncbi:MAG: YncE family protein [Planctomycetota bacterium]